MKVLVAFEFKGVDPNSSMADAIVDFLGKSCEMMRKELSLDCNVYVDDCVATEVETDVPNKQHKPIDKESEVSMGEFLMEVGGWLIAIGITSVMFILLMYCLAVVFDVITREKGQV